MQVARNLLLLISLLVPCIATSAFGSPLPLVLSQRNRLVHVPDLENLSMTLAQAHIGSKLYGNEIRAQFMNMPILCWMTTT
jgi:hypothetical protein